MLSCKIRLNKDFRELEVLSSSGTGFTKPPYDKGHLKLKDFLEFLPPLKMSVSQIILPQR